MRDFLILKKKQHTNELKNKDRKIDKYQNFSTYIVIASM